MELLGWPSLKTLDGKDAVIGQSFLLSLIYVFSLASLGRILLSKLRIDVFLKNLADISFFDPTVPPSNIYVYERFQYQTFENLRTSKTRLPRFFLFCSETLIHGS